MLTKWTEIRNGVFQNGIHVLRRGSNKLPFSAIPSADASVPIVWVWQCLPDHRSTVPSADDLLRDSAFTYCGDFESFAAATWGVAQHVAEFGEEGY